MTSEHWLHGVRPLPSPNQDPRPPGQSIDLVVLHHISLPPGSFEGGFVEALFLNDLDTSAHESFAGLKGLKVSSHLFISRSGVVTQFVPFDRRAWHAGVSSHEGRGNCNDYSIGIELEGTGSLAYTASQYGGLQRVLQALLTAYPRLSPERIVGHQEIAPGRKTDPGTSFDWRLTLTSAAQLESLAVDEAQHE